MSSNHNTTAIPTTASNIIHNVTLQQVSEYQSSCAYSYIVLIPNALKNDFMTKCCLFIVQFIYFDIPILILYKEQQVENGDKKVNNSNSNHVLLYEKHKKVAIGLFKIMNFIYNAIYAYKNQDIYLDLTTNQKMKSKYLNQFGCILNPEHQFKCQSTMNKMKKWQSTWNILIFNKESYINKQQFSEIESELFIQPTPSAPFAASDSGITAENDNYVVEKNRILYRHLDDLIGNPLCGQSLLNKLIRTCHIQHMIQYKFYHSKQSLAKEKIDIPRTYTILDVGCLFIFLPWMNQYAAFMSRLKAWIPHVVHYVEGCIRHLFPILKELNIYREDQKWGTGPCTLWHLIAEAKGLWLDLNMEANGARDATSHFLQGAKGSIGLGRQEKPYNCEAMKTTKIDSDASVCQRMDIGRENTRAGMCLDLGTPGLESACPVNITYRTRVKYQGLQDGCTSIGNGSDCDSCCDSGLAKCAMQNHPHYQTNLAMVLKLVEWKSMLDVFKALPFNNEGVSLRDPEETAISCKEPNNVSDGCLNTAIEASCDDAAELLDIDYANYPGLVWGSLSESSNHSPPLHVRQGNIDKIESCWNQMGLPPRRETRKKQQILSLCSLILPQLPAQSTLVEFCCGGGYVGLLIAALRPDVSVVLTDRNSISLAYAANRAKQLRCTNVTVAECDLLELQHAVMTLRHASQSRCGGTNANNGHDSSQSIRYPWLSEMTMGVGLHACGRATDAIQYICTHVRCSYVLAPCCYGFVQHWDLTKRGAMEYLQSACNCRTNSDPSLNTSINANVNCEVPKQCVYMEESYPKSKRYVNLGWEYRWFGHVCSLADKTFSTHDSRHEVFDEHAQRAMCVIDNDRVCYGLEWNYSVVATRMLPLEASTKNHIIIGTPLELGGPMLASSEEGPNV